MSKNDLSGEQLAGCIAAVWSLFVTTPIWLVLLFVVLNAHGNAVPARGYAIRHGFDRCVISVRLQECHSISNSGASLTSIRTELVSKRRAGRLMA